jgi:RecJ-like exonuclease
MKWNHTEIRWALKTLQINAACDIMNRASDLIALVERVLPKRLADAAYRVYWAVDAAASNWFSRVYQGSWEEIEQAWDHDGERWLNDFQRKVAAGRILPYVCAVVVACTMAAGSAPAQTNAPAVTNAVASTNAPAVCPTCKGVPHRRCNVCAGYGQIRCPNCRGAKFGPEREVSTPCRSCQGRGRWNVDVYQTVGGGAGQRAEKRVVGQREVVCPQCKGAGSETSREATYCPACNGTGAVTCPRCAGRKTITCPTCKGAR